MRLTRWEYRFLTDNRKADSYTKVRINKPYLAVGDDYYIQLKNDRASDVQNDSLHLFL